MTIHEGTIDPTPYIALKPGEREAFESAGHGLHLAHQEVWGETTFLCQCWDVDGPLHSEDSPVEVGVFHHIEDWAEHADQYV